MKLVIGLLLAASLHAQSYEPRSFPPETPRFGVMKETALTAATEKVTIQSVVGTKVTFESASVYCSVACDVTFYQNGTAATATAVTFGNSVFFSMNGVMTPTSTVFSGSNVGSGVTTFKYSIPAGGTFSFDCTKLYMSPSLVGNFTIGISSITGTARITAQWVEQYPS